MSYDKKKVMELVEKLQKDACIEDEQKPFFSFGRDVYHKKEPCYFCGFTGNNRGEGRYIHSPLSEMAEEEGITEKEIMDAAILFCGACMKMIEDLDVLEMCFD